MDRQITMSEVKLLDAALFSPIRIQPPNAWVGHLPFAAWVVRELNPSIFVELGTHSGNSYFSFCQSIQENKLNTKAYAVDTWKGDEHAGFYGEEIWNDVDAYNEEHYKSFSTLIRKTFDDAVGAFDDGSIDLLHIDGLHSYEAVKHDFEIWLPKVSSRGVILFHDTVVKERGFGVYKLWDELSQQYPGFNFEHSYGLGVLLVGEKCKFSLNKIAADNNKISECKDVFERLGNKVFESATLNQNVAERDGQITGLNEAVAERDGQITGLNRIVSEYKESTSWKLTAPLRWPVHQVKRVVHCTRILPHFIRQTGGIIALTKKVLLVVKDEGWNGIKLRIKSHANRPVRSGIHSIDLDVLDLKSMLPAEVCESNRKLFASGIVDIIIPVYKGLNQTRDCINSVLNSNVKTLYRLIIINDASPEMEISEYLQSISLHECVTIIENDENLGFTATVNRGMALSDKNDVLLLNSDTRVANNWLDKLRVHAYAHSRVGTVTPFSNNGTICNYPTLDGMKEFPFNESLEEFEGAFSQANHEQNIEIPTAVGFCMFIRRDCLNDVGMFDVETFGKGYGEENDFCLRATAKGWVHLLAADTFVFHEGEVSFQEGSNPRKERAMQIIRQRYPDYERLVAEHIAANAIYPLQVAATAARFKCRKLPVILHILHSYGGGTEKHVDQLCRTQEGRSKTLIMTTVQEMGKETQLRIVSTDALDALNLELPCSNFDFLVSLLKSFGVSLVHVHHVIGYPFDIQKIVIGLGVEFYTTIHDYNLLCPYIYMMPPGEKYCGAPTSNLDCNQCISANYPQDCNDIIWWRESHAWIFKDSKAVICPSYDVQQRCQRYFPDAEYRVVTHEKPPLNRELLEIHFPEIQPSEPLRVALLGVLTDHKGFGLIRSVVREAQKNNLPLSFHLIGYTCGTIDSSLFSQTGAYNDEDLIDKIDEYDPHLILFSSCCPETYSYTLTAAIKSGRPVMVPNLGAFPERIASRQWSWVVNWNVTAHELVNKLCDVRLNHILPQVPPEPVSYEAGRAFESIKSDDFYENEYLSINDAYEGVIDLRKEGRISALLLIETLNGVPSPCAYIRLIMPLIREQNEDFIFRLVTADKVKGYKADVLITQRTSVTSIIEIDEIVSHCRIYSMKIIYDIDDFLLMLPNEHPDKNFYQLKSSQVFRWLAEADEVWVSTESLKKKICELNPKTHVIHNYVDDKLWKKEVGKSPVKTANDPIRIVYMGTQTHIADFELIKDDLKKLKREFSKKVEIILIGIMPTKGKDRWYTTIDIPNEINCNYPAFIHWLDHKNTFDIGIAPLVDNAFNRCKSAIKFLDYSALGLATVASDINGYNCIEDGINGFVVNNDEWFDVLRKIIVDSKLRAKIQTKAHHGVFEKYGYNSIKGNRIELLRSLNLKDVKHNDHAKIRTYTDVDRATIASAFLCGTGIEIGALHNPLPVAYSINVKYVDRFDKSGLYEQYPELRKHKLVDIDFIDDGEKLSTFSNESQDFIIANHFLEHCEDPIATLKTFFRVLRVHGTIFLALPDKRFTFDIDRQRTSLSHLIKDHVEGSNHSRLEHFLEWPKFVEPHFGRKYATKEEIEHRAHELMNQNYSIHYHVWEPSDVHELLIYCAAKQNIPLRIECFISRGDEMIIILRKKV